MKAKLQADQPIFYQTLHNCITSNKLSHALLLSGSKGASMLGAAKFIAQCKVCEHDVMACGQCDECRRIESQTYADLMILDGTQKSIKKEEVLQIQERFQKTALEANGNKIYILNRAENATIEALNSLLKFLEEPQGDSTTAVLIVEEIDRLLPTILSRCQIIPFRALKQEDCFNEALDFEVQREDAFVLSHFIKDVSVLSEASQSESYQKALAGVKYFLEHMDALDLVLVWLDCEVFNNKDLNKECLVYFIEILLVVLDCSTHQIEVEFEWLETALVTIEKEKISVSAWVLILLETKDKCARAFNLGLLVNEMMINLKEVSA